MQHKQLKTWGEFEIEVGQLRTQLNRSRSDLLFRGHSNSAWQLQTTLERESDRHDFSIVTYYRVIGSIKAEIESYTDAQWECPTFPEINELAKGYDDFSRAVTSGRLPAYKYMAYLRHHGFPSPLLDWTTSPFIAAYFAFRKISKNTQNVSIFVYCEAPDAGKFRSSNRPAIHQLGPNVSTHQRHFRQQSEYTICTFWKDNSDWCFVPHSEIFDLNPERNPLRQDVLWKFDIPTSEREEVLRLLDEYNLNAYSLFGSDESLMETLAFRNLTRFG